VNRQKQISRLLAAADTSKPLWVAMGLTSSKDTEYIKLTMVAKPALGEQPILFSVEKKWSSVKSKSVRELQVTKVEKAIKCVPPCHLRTL
jgi:hypothetical protein